MAAAMSSVVWPCRRKKETDAALSECALKVFGGTTSGGARSRKPFTMLAMRSAVSGWRSPSVKRNRGVWPRAAGVKRRTRCV